MSIRLSSMFPAVFGAFALIGGMFMMPFGARTNVPPQQTTPVSTVQRTVSVSGSGAVQATPNIARIVLGVQSEAEAAADALTTNSDQMESLMTALRGAGIAAADIQTRTVQLYPRYSDSTVSPSTEGQSTQNRIAGYTAVNTVMVTVRDIEKVGALIDTAVQAGSNQVESISFDVDQPAELVDNAREAAFADARRKAGQLAALAEGSLGSVISVTESSYFPVAFQQEAAVMDRVAASVPVSPGSQTLTVDVQVVFELVVETPAE